MSSALRRFERVQGRPRRAPGAEDREQWDDGCLAPVKHARRHAGVALLIMYAGTANAAEPAARGTVVPLFSIAKSQNRNQVQYAIRVDARCVPTSNAPVFSYWRMLEQGAARTAPMLPREDAAYGLATQRVTAQNDASGTVLIALKAVPDRSIVVKTSLGPRGTCQALSNMTIAGTPAHLFNVYVRLKSFFRVSYILLRGWSMDGKRVVSEKLKG